MKIYVSGGAKNGKSHFAQTRAKELSVKLGIPLYYVATMIPVDDEDRSRISRHIADREGMGFETLEQGNNILEILDAKLHPDVEPKGVFLLDSVTALLANEMFWGGNYNPHGGEKTRQDLLAFVKQVDHCIMVSDYIYGDSGPFDEFTEGYIKALAIIDKALAQACDQVYEITAGQPILHKGNKNG